MKDSPCRYCPKCPCKEHDTCESYQVYKAERTELHKKITAAHKEDYYARLAVRRCMKWQAR